MLLLFSDCLLRHGGNHKTISVELELSVKQTYNPYNERIKTGLHHFYSEALKYYFT